MEICIDFDGTCVTHDYPRVGRDIGAVPVLKELVKNRHLLILFTMRSSKQGVSFHKGIGKWRAYVKRKFLGWWDSEEEAYLARIKFLDQISASEK